MYTPKVNVSERFLRYHFGTENMYSVGYCDMQRIISALGLYPEYYTCGIYGWKADIYVVDGKVICTGYAPIGKKKVDYKKLSAAENHLDELPWEKRRAYARRVFKRLFV